MRHLSIILVQGLNWGGYLVIFELVQFGRAILISRETACVELL